VVHRGQRAGSLVYVWVCITDTNTFQCFQQWEIAKYLLFRGAKLDIDSSGRGDTALYWAAACGAVPIIRLLASRPGFNMDCRDCNGSAALHHVANLSTTDGCSQVHEAISELLSLGADMEARNIFHATPLLEACHAVNYSMAIELLRRGADLEPARGVPELRHIQPLLFWAVRIPRQSTFLGGSAIRVHDCETNGDLVKALIRAGADANARHSDNAHHSETVQMRAC